MSNATCYTYQLSGNQFGANDIKSLISILEVLYKTSENDCVVEVVDSDHVHVIIGSETFACLSQRSAEIISHYEQDNKSKAEELSDGLVKEFPFWSEGWCTIGRIHSDMYRQNNDEGFKDKAIDELLQALKLDKENYVALCILAKLYEGSVNETAEQYYNLALKIKPKYIEALYGLFFLHNTDSDVSVSVDAFEALVSDEENLSKNDAAISLFQRMVDSFRLKDLSKIIEQDSGKIVDIKELKTNDYFEPTPNKIFINSNRIESAYYAALYAFNLKLNKWRKAIPDPTHNLISNIEFNEKCNRFFDVYRQFNPIMGEQLFTRMYGDTIMMFAYTLGEMFGDLWLLRKHPSSKVLQAYTLKNNLLSRLSDVNKSIKQFEDNIAKNRVIARPPYFAFNIQKSMLFLKALNLKEISGVDIVSNFPLDKEWVDKCSSFFYDKFQLVSADKYSAKVESALFSEMAKDFDMLRK